MNMVLALYEFLHAYEDRLLEKTFCRIGHIHDYALSSDLVWYESEATTKYTLYYTPLLIMLT